MAFCRSNIILCDMMCMMYDILCNNALCFYVHVLFEIRF